MNKVIITGRLTRDPEVRYTKSGKAVASFTVAVDRRLGRRAQEQAGDQPTADFIPCVAWEHQADFVGNHLIKGSPVLVEGRMQVRTYEAQDGSRRYVTEVVVNNIEFNGPRPQGAGAPGAGAPMGQAAPQPQAPQGNGGFGNMPNDDEILF